MIKIYEIEENNFGYILTNFKKTEKLNLYKSKHSGDKYAPFYLLQIKPNKIYISGMFFQKNKINTMVNQKMELNFKLLLKIIQHILSAKVKLKMKNKREHK